MRTVKILNHGALPFFAAAAVSLGIVIARADGDVRSAVSAGQKAPAFQARTLEGQTVNFPGDYKGKVVLLDFWATWCAPCRMELPNVVATYQKYHAMGFDVLGVSLDDAQQGPALQKFVQAHNMPWPQIYDGRSWNAAVAVQYGVQGIPCPVLVDGDTGVIIAQGADAIGDKLPQLVKTSLAGMARK